MAKKVGSNFFLKDGKLDIELKKTVCDATHSHTRMALSDCCWRASSACDPTGNRTPVARMKTWRPNR